MYFGTGVRRRAGAPRSSGECRSTRQSGRPGEKVHIRCRCGSGKGISIIVTDQGKGFDFGKVLANGVTADPAAAHGHGIPADRSVYGPMCILHEAVLKSI